MAILWDDWPALALKKDIPVPTKIFRLLTLCPQLCYFFKKNSIKWQLMTCLAGSYRLFSLVSPNIPHYRGILVSTKQFLIILIFLSDMSV